MFTKLIAALILASFSVALTSTVNAGPRAPDAETAWMERASKTYDGGGN